MQSHLLSISINLLVILEKNRGPAIKLSNSGKSKNVFEGDGAAEAGEL